MSNVFAGVKFSDLSATSVKVSAQPKEKRASVGVGRRGFGVVNPSGIPGPEKIHEVMRDMYPHFQEYGGVPSDMIIEKMREFLTDSSIRVYLSEYCEGNSKGKPALWNRGKRGRYIPL